ncbi:HD domain-containing protein [Stenotrophomonas sp.]|uniref:HD domain-containing protein n=1 Tax=Stenotrophomonas sp. TaxID=69392 RepID=UPI0028A0B8BE|nr:HD domain-containing protein [Stenotrophomonas sp.]
MEWIARARALATRAHAGQVDKAGQPYIGHVGRVAARVSGDDDTEVVAWLHDVVEDCPAYAAQVQDFPEHIQRAVQLLSRSSTADADLYYAGIAANPMALKVKVADIADNADEQRLGALDPATAERLRGKYRLALAALGQAQV